ncbi:hypothetical protein DSM104299_02417 [Baekduia alba]|uniref:DUF6691 family protein n=1 Tax=Baekduia alba TaxID=2997333 RepID=UPI0023418328|nr:DUF6691 family protein [Baekduia alba]WCB93701.1 hypothetical protein DSM104299_02417 [Baekduia alba]
MRKVLAGAAVGVAFGVVISWSGMASPDVIRQALLFEQSYLFLMFASAVATAWVGLALLRRRERRAVFGGEPLTYARDAVERRHVVGALLFGIGWGVADACPAPIATQLGQGVGWAVFTAAGAAFGIWAYLRLRAVETEPASDAARARSAEPAVSPTS